MLTATLCAMRYDAMRCDAASRQLRELCRKEYVCVRNGQAEAEADGSDKRRSVWRREGGSIRGG